MREHTKKRHTESGLIPLHFLVHADNVKRITSYVESIEPGAISDSITVEEFYDQHFPDQSKASVALKGYRYRENLTQQQLSAMTGIPQRHISEMENGKRIIGVTSAKKLAKALNCDYRGLL
jgi:DNA-binding XRE family transcriptional regulator